MPVIAVWLTIPSVILSPIGDNPHPVERPHASPSRRTADPPEARHHVLALLRITFLKSKWAHGVSCLVASALSTSASAVRLDEDLYGPDISAASDQLGQSRPAWLHLLLEAADLLRKLAGERCRRVAEGCASQIKPQAR